MGKGGEVLGKRRHKLWTLKPPCLSGAQELLLSKSFPKCAHTPFQASRVSTFGFPKWLQKVTQQPKAAPNLTAARLSPLHLSREASSHGHRRRGPTPPGTAQLEAAHLPPGSPRAPPSARTHRVPFHANPQTRPSHRETKNSPRCRLSSSWTLTASGLKRAPKHHSERLV